MSWSVNYINFQNQKQSKKKSGGEWSVFKEDIRITELQKVLKMHPGLKQTQNYEYSNTIHQIFLVTNTTFLIVTKVKFRFIHLDKDGNPIKSWSFNNVCRYSVEIVSRRVLLASIVISESQQSKPEHLIVQWNLQTDERIILPLQYTSAHWHHKMIVFAESKLCCSLKINYDKQKEDQQIIVRYFEYPLKSQSQQAVHQNKLKVKGSAFSLEIHKVNEKSKFCIIAPNSKKQHLCTFYQVNEHKSPQTYSIDDSLLVSKQQCQYCQVKIIDLWQIKPNIFYIHLDTQLILDTIEQKHPNFVNLSDYLHKELDKLQNHYNFIWDCQTSVLRPTKFKTDGKFCVEILGTSRNIKRHMKYKYPIRDRFGQEKHYFAQLVEKSIIVLPIYLIDLQYEEILAKKQQQQYIIKSKMQNYLTFFQRSQRLFQQCCIYQKFNFILRTYGSKQYCVQVNKIGKSNRKLGFSVLSNLFDLKL